ncbi:serine hydrolase-domain-containing protein [Tricladium varicosporioides]|nr:serine hydrolase-domain-containing protein [Hymenoscyphus varicosporioides]
MTKLHQEARYFTDKRAESVYFKPKFGTHAVTCMFRTSFYTKLSTNMLCYALDEIRMYGTNNLFAVRLKSAGWDIARASQRAKVLMLHGNGESGESFKNKTRFFKNLLQNACPHFPGGFELFYPTAPHRMQPAGSITREERDFDAWTWGFGNYMTEAMQGYEQTIRYMLEVIRTAGPFIGVVGFSAGAATAHTLVSLAERRASPELMQSFQIDSSLLPPPFHFAICSSGFILSHPQYKSLYYPRIKTPVLHFIGNFDPIIPEDHTLKLAGRCKNRLIVHHPGAHFVPRGTIFQKAMIKVRFYKGVAEKRRDRLPKRSSSSIDFI